MHPYALRKAILVFLGIFLGLVVFGVLVNSWGGARGQFCGGLAGKGCPFGFSCRLDGDYPDAGGICKKDPLGWIVDVLR